MGVLVWGWLHGFTKSVVRFRFILFFPMAAITSGVGEHFSNQNGNVNGLRIILKMEALWMLIQRIEYEISSLISGSKRFDKNSNIFFSNTSFFLYYNISFAPGTYSLIK